MDRTNPKLVEILDAHTDGYWRLIFPQDFTDIKDYRLSDIGKWDEFYSEKLIRQLAWDQSTEKPTKASFWLDLMYKEDRRVVYEELVNHLDSGGASKFKVVVRFEAMNGKHLKVKQWGNVVMYKGKPVSMTGMQKVLEISSKKIT